MSFEERLAFKKAFEEHSRHIFEYYGNYDDYTMMGIRVKYKDGILTVV